MGIRAGRGAAVVVTALVALVPSVATAQDPTSAPSSTVPAVPAATGEDDVVVHLVDIGPALGLPQDSHSWDLDVGRIDADTVPDLAVGDHDRLRVYLNRRPGLELTLDWNLTDPHGCAIGDADGNGLGDIFCTRGAERGAGVGNKRLLMQTSEGVWIERSEAYGVTDPYGRGRRTTWIDLDHQGGLDLFVGNEVGRTDGEVSYNRTFVDAGSQPLDGGRLGPIGDKGAVCVQAVDQDGDGWQDLLLCGGSSPPGQHPGVIERLYLYRNQERAGGGRRLVDVAGARGIALRGVRSARLARLNGDRLLDLVTVERGRLAVRSGLSSGGFGPPAYTLDLTAGNWVAVGDVDGDGDNDLFVVQACSPSGNERDVLLQHIRGWRYRTVPAPMVRRGCGDTAAMIDVDGDGLQDVVVGNGRWAARGPMQLLTAGPWRG